MFRHVFWATGFRSFFFFGAAAAAALAPAWALMYRGSAAANPVFGTMDWHSHEMLLGFVPAILAGFLLTAVRNWTGRHTAAGGALAVLVCLWAAGRVAVLLADHLPGLAVAAIDAAFLPALAVAIGRPLWVTRNMRNIGFPPLLLLMASANVAWYGSALGVWPSVAAAVAVRVTLDAALLFLVVVGGRIIPLFTGNALPEAGVSRVRWADALAWPSLALVLLCHLAGPLVAPQVTGAVSLAAGLVQGARMSRWGTSKTWRSPIVWILHLGYAWLALGLVLQGVHGLWRWPSQSVATHALTVGALGTLLLGMIARVCLGHTGRPLRVHGAMVVAFVCLQAAALLRTAVAAAAPPWYPQTVLLAAALWSLAFCLFLIIYWPVVTSPRPDGKPG